MELNSKELPIPPRFNLVESFYQSDGTFTVNVSTTFANHDNIEVIVYLADGDNGNDGTGGGNGQFAAGGAGGPGGIGYMNVVKLSGEDLGWTSGQSF